MPSFDDDIEITQPLTVSASISFKIDREEWEKADEDTRRAIVAARCDSAQGEFDCYGGVGGVYLTIDSWLPEERVEYDRQKEV